MLVTKAVLTRWLRASMILYHRLAACGQTAAFDAVEAKFVDDEQTRTWHRSGRGHGWCGRPGRRSGLPANSPLVM